MRARWLGVFAVVLVGVTALATIAVIDDDASGGSDSVEPSPMDLAVVGDSLAEQAREDILSMAEERGLDATVDAWGGSALCGWMWLLGELRENPPDRLVLSFVGNITNDCVNPSCRTECQPIPAEQVATTYRQHLDMVRGLFAETSTEIAVVLPPPMGEPSYDERGRAMREMYLTAQRADPRIVVIDSSTQLDPDGTGFHEALPCAPAVDACQSGEAVVLRHEDKIHLSSAGARRYAVAILDGLDLT